MSAGKPETVLRQTLAGLVAKWLEFAKQDRFSPICRRRQEEMASELRAALESDLCPLNKKERGQP